MKNTNTIFNLAVTGVQKLVPYTAGKPIEELAREKNLTKIVNNVPDLRPARPACCQTDDIEPG